MFSDININMPAKISTTLFQKYKLHTGMAFDWGGGSDKFHFGMQGLLVYA